MITGLYRHALMSEDLATQINELRESIDDHRDELKAVRDAVDELREAIEHLALNLPTPCGHEIGGPTKRV